MIGDIFCDIVAKGVQELPQWNSDTLCQGIHLIPGGSALNTTVHAAYYSRFNVDHGISAEPVQIELFSVVGDDIYGDICLKALDKHSEYITQSIVRKPEEATGACIVISGAADRTFITSRGAVEALSLSWFDEARLLDTDHLHIAGYYNCRNLIPSLPELFAKVSL